MKAGSQTPARRTRAGQTMIFLILAVVLIAFLAFWVFDLHKIIHVKFLSQNAGDSAALAAARWQGTTLNLIGDLNILQAVALTQGDDATATEIAELQARLCFVGPLTGFLAAQQAAKNNGIFNNPEFTARVMEHAQTIRNDYGRTFGPDGNPLFPEPYPGAWDDYATMVELIASAGIAAAPDNARFYTDYAGPHILLDPAFYDAVAGRLWCWFFHHHPTLLEDYTGYAWWPPLPDQVSAANPINCEFFGLGLARLSAIQDPDAIRVGDALRQERGLGTLSADPAAAMSVTSAWYCYAPDRWTDWGAFSPTNADPFPAAGLIRPQYDYAGADAAVRIQASPTRITPDSRPADITWTAAAKPFGHLERDPPPGEVRPDTYGLVLPAFHAVRLIPVDTSSAPAAGAFDLEWRQHIETHLPEYMRGGPAVTDPYCWYCAQLRQWEDPAFRQQGIDWLDANSDLCEQSGGGGGGGGPGGGSRRGH